MMKNTSSADPQPQKSLLDHAQDEIKSMKKQGKIIVKYAHKDKVEYLKVDRKHQVCATFTKEYGEILYQLSYMEGIRD